MEGFCGKNCDTCTWRETLHCGGCQSGPGRPVSGDCDIAACCRSKGHAQCGTCLLSGCGLRAGRDHMPERRQRNIEAERESRRRLDSNAPELGKWLWLLFWLVIPSVVGSLMSNETVLSVLPGLQVPGQVLNLLCTLAYGAILWRLWQTESGYRIAGVCHMAAGVVTALADVLQGIAGNGLTLLLLLSALVVQLYGVYREYNAHAAVLDGADDGLAEKWRKLWKWEIGLILGLMGCLVLAIFSAVLGLLALLADVIGMLAVSVLKLMYLYRTAKLFREHIPVEREALPE